MAWLRDQAYDFLYYDVGTALDFVGDMFRGPSGYSKSLHRQAAKAGAKGKPEKPLTRSERAVFAQMLRRKAGEPQIAYWKRKKALLTHPDKHDLVRQQRSLEAEMARRQTGSKITVDAQSTPRTPGARPKLVRTQRQRR